MPSLLKNKRLWRTNKCKVNYVEVSYVTHWGRIFSEITIWILYLHMIPPMTSKKNLRFLNWVFFLICEITNGWKILYATSGKILLQCIHPTSNFVIPHSLLIYADLGHFLYDVYVSFTHFGKNVCWTRISIWVHFWFIHNFFSGKTF